MKRIYNGKSSIVIGLMIAAVMVVALACGGDEETPAAAPDVAAPAISTSVPVPEPSEAAVPVGALELLEVAGLPKTQALEQIGDAVVELTELIASDSDDLVSLHRRGFARLALQEYDKALSDFNSEIAQDPEFPDAYLGKALALAGKAQLDDAVEAVNVALALDPDYTDAESAKALLLDWQAYLSQ